MNALRAPAPSEAAKIRAPAGLVGILPASRWVPAFIGFWTVFGLLFALRDRYWSAFVGEDPGPWMASIVVSLFTAYSTGVLALAALFVARRISLEGGWVRGVFVHVVAGVSAIAAALMAAYTLALFVLAPPRPPLLSFAIGLIPAWALTYVLVLGIGYGLQFVHRARERDLRNAQLEGQLARAQLQALNMELHPHFLFNALNSISALMHRDVPAADRMLGRLQDLFRLTLEKGAAQVVPLREELEILEPYLEIEQARFGDRLSIEWRIDGAVLDAAVPQLVLQPLVENAIKHGIAPHRARGRIRITAYRDGGDLRLEVADSGRGFGTDTPSRNGTGGIGLLNTRARLQRLYGDRFRLELTAGASGGACVRIRLPFELATPTPTGAL